MDKKDVAISLISAAVITFLIPTIFYTLGRYIEKVLVKKELVRMLDLITLQCPELQELKKHVEKSSKDKYECAICIHPLYVYTISTIISLSLLLMGLVASQFEDLWSIFKHVSLIVLIFIFVEVQILLILGVLYKPLNIYAILHK